MKPLITTLALVLTLGLPLCGTGRAAANLRRHDGRAAGVLPMAAQAPATAAMPALDQADPAARIKKLQPFLRRADRANIPWLVKLAESDPDAGVRKAIIDRLGRVDDPAVAQMLERRATSDPDAGVALLALERLRVRQARQLGEIFEKRLALARSANDAASLRALTAESQRWATHAQGATLPGFLQQPPPVFEAIPSRRSVRVLAFGDYGTGNEHMTQTAAAARAYHARRPFDLGITLGDNLPPSGPASLADPRWKSEWEDLYGTMGIPVFASTGNHDWGFADSPAAEILYSRQSRTWRMPSLYYSFVAGPVQFFALATYAISGEQMQWLDRELGRSTARWKVVYGHHPIYSYGSHGDTKGLDKTLLPVLKNRAHVYLVGHEHTVQHLKPADGVHLMVAPAAGQGVRQEAHGPRTLYTGSFYGFVAIEAGPDELKFSFVDTEGKARYETALK